MFALNGLLLAALALALRRAFGEAVALASTLYLQSIRQWQRIFRW